MAAPTIGSSTATVYFKSGNTWYDAVHPVNSFYFSVSSTSPASLFGGTWTEITGGAAIRAISTTNTGTGITGSDTHTLTVWEMPSHNHGVDMKFASSEATGYGLMRGTSLGFLDRVVIENGGNFYGGQMEYTGGGAAHSIVQRSFNCYVWYRTA